MRKRVATTTAVFQPGYPAEKAIERLAGLGFEALDMALDYWVKQSNSPFSDDGYLEWAKRLKKKAEDFGVCYVQSHAPGDASNKEFYLERSIEITGALGASYMVVHPVYTYSDGTIINVAENFIKLNAELIRPWLEKAQQCGVIILSENLLWGVSSDPAIIAALVQEVDSEWFGWCYDTGHANCFGYSPKMLRECVVSPNTLHIHDNYGKSDDHLIPGEGTLDWELLIEMLKESGYSGDCVLEAHHQSLEVHGEERDKILTRLLDSAVILRDKMI